MGLVLSMPMEVFGATSHYEAYAYRTLEDHGAWSIRAYEPGVAAETVVDNDDRGFGRLARYIGVFGTPENRGQDAVAMTVPVVSGSSGPTAVAMTVPVVNGQGGGTMRFVLPSKYRRPEDAPAPTDPRVRLVALPGYEAAALQFSGSCGGMEDAREQYETLAASLKKHGGWTPSGAWELHRFNPPYTLAPFRTNEVVVPVTRTVGAPDAAQGA